MVKLIMGECNDFISHIWINWKETRERASEGFESLNVTKQLGRVENADEWENF